MTKTTHIKHFDKYDFIKAFVATASISDPKLKEEKEKEAELIAKAIEEAQETTLENVANKQDVMLLLKEMQLIKYQMIGAVATLIVFLPSLSEAIKKIFGF